MDLDSETLDKIYNMSEEDARNELKIREIVMNEVQKALKKSKSDKDTMYYL